MTVYMVTGMFEKILGAATMQWDEDQGSVPYYPWVKFCVLVQTRHI